MRDYHVKAKNLLQIDKIMNKLPDNIASIVEEQFLTSLEWTRLTLCRALSFGFKKIWLMQHPTESMTESEEDMFYESIQKQLKQSPDHIVVVSVPRSCRSLKFADRIVRLSSRS